MSKFLLLLGPSGVGKSSIIDELTALDGRFTYISPYMTRDLRPAETNKIPISDKLMDEMNQRGEFLVINTLFGGTRYATPRLPILQALQASRFPVLDWPIAQLNAMTTVFTGQVFCVYIAPPSIEILQERLLMDGRDQDGKRLQSAKEELQKYCQGDYDGLYDLAVVSEEGEVDKAASLIYKHYLKSF